MTDYILAGVPRSGTNWLCTHLRHCGAGNAREWAGRYREDWFREMCLQKQDHLRALKVFWHHLVQVFPFDPGAYLMQYACWMPDVRWVYLTREDKLRQALSFCRVHAGGGWVLTQATPWQAIDIAYDRQQIQRHLDSIQQQEQSWEAHFQRYAITPLRLTYEMMAADLRGTVETALDYLDVGSWRERDCPLQKQAREDVECLVRRYEYEMER